MARGKKEEGEGGGRSRGIDCVPKEQLSLLELGRGASQGRLVQCLEELLLDCVLHWELFMLLDEIEAMHKRCMR